jgi:outer membrane protein assembly factor BamB
MRLIVTFLFITLAATAADWPQWRQADGNAIFSEPLPDLNKVDVAWKFELGVGYAGISIADGKAYTLGHDGKADETLYCFEAKTGKVIWKHRYQGKLLPDLHRGGPNATPLIRDGKLYSVSKDGQVMCLDAATGKLHWHVNAAKDSKTEIPRWGFAGSPLLVDGKLLVDGTAALALDPSNGKLLWTANTPAKAAYASPMPFQVKGKWYAAVKSGVGAHVISLVDGKKLADFPMRANFDMIATTPMLFPDAPGEFYVTTSQVSARLRWTGTRLETVWVTTDMKNKFSNAVLIDGWLYGVDGRQKTKRAGVFCINAATGKAAWQQSGIGHGTVVAGSNGILFLTDNGELVHLEANPKAFTVKARKQVLQDICWTQPTVAHGRIYVRNDRGTLLCLK